MTRDYARSSRSKPVQPPWPWIIMGLLIGLFVAFLVYINRIEIPEQGGQGNTQTSVTKPRAAPAPEKKPKPAPGKDDKKVHFDFYKLLPEYEVVIPEEDLQKPELKETAPGKYLLQAGSFSTADDADTRRAQLALLGLVAKVETVTIDGKDTWHRVQLGPYEEPQKIDQARKLLQTSDIDFLLLKAKD